MKTKKEKKGAGKPAFFSKPMERINVTLDPETIAFYKKVGGGNLSEGIRRYWRGLTPLALDGRTRVHNCETCSCEICMAARSSQSARQ